jgi:hypothetical protein
MTTIDQAWKKYQDDCEQMRQAFLSDPMARKYPSLAANAHFVLLQTQAMAYNLVMAPRQHSPGVMDSQLFEPLLYTAHQPNPDFHYQIAFVDGARRWRIRGRRNSAHWVDLQVLRGWWGDENAISVGQYDLDDFEIRPDGTFEIIASPEPQPGNWIHLDPTSRNNVLQFRPAMYDWEREVPVQMYIEAMDEGSRGPAILDDTEIIRRIELCGEFVKHCIGRWTTRGSPALQQKAGMNQFLTRRGDPARGGANPKAQYGQAVYELARDEALIIETANPKAKYWGISLGTWWWETTDPTHHHTSINGHQAVLDSDGRFRAVVSFQDPGVPNWLDPVCWEVGIILLRWYRAESEQQVTTTKVPVAELRRHLPADTPTVTAAQRADGARWSRRAVMAWYGYRPPY